MAAALYDAEAGYYTRHVRTVGARGDFTTSPVLDGALATAVAAWLAERWEQNAAPRGSVIEIGAGDGSLAAAIIKAFGFMGRRGLKYHIVEISRRLQAVQRERLAKHRRRVHWHREVADALGALDGGALIISNELVDAFPASLLETDEDGVWRELTLHPEADDRWRTEPAEAYQLPEGSSLATTDHRFATGQRIERHDSYFEWLAGWLPAWRRGSMLTIDYGAPFPAVYHRRPRGTLRAYFAQQRYEDLAEILAHPGRQDLTCDVDFTDLSGRGTALGLEARPLLTQAEFIARLSPSQGDSPAADPHGAGGAFHVLEQRRDRD